MSDMSRPDPMPADAHEQHDPLLVAQYAANDPLDEAQLREAAQLVSSCAQCAELAADLRVLSGVVAWEPVPPRRRDFRITAEQAQKARGNSLQRFMQRLALPQATSLRPVAAGVMSLGLLFVVAGSVWPDSAAEPQAAGGGDPAALVSPDPRFRDQEGLFAASPVPAAADTLGQTVEREAPLAVDMVGTPSDADQAAESAAGSDALNANIADRAQTLDDVPELETLGELDALDELTAKEPAAVEPAAVERAAELPSAARKSVARDSAAEAFEPSTEFADDLATQRQERPDSSIAADAVLEFAERENRDGTSESEGQTSGGRLGGEAQDIAEANELQRDRDTSTIDASEQAQGDSGIDLSMILLVLGVILATGGLLLLVLLWFARRTSDPLVP
jgi:hypothetical protein